MYILYNNHQLNSKTMLHLNLFWQRFLIKGTYNIYAFLVRVICCDYIKYLTTGDV